MEADSDWEGLVGDLEILSYISMWKSGNAAMLDLLDAIDEWKGA